MENTSNGNSTGVLPLKINDSNGRDCHIWNHMDLMRFIEHGEINEEDLERMLDDYLVDEDMRTRHDKSIEISKSIHIPFEMKMRKLFNRMYGRARGYSVYDGDDISMAMDENYDSWKSAYNSDDWWGMYEVLLNVNDSLQAHGGAGIWGGNPSREKFQEAIQYRCLLSDDMEYAFNDEFYSMCFGWW